MIIDANILIYSVDERSPFYLPASQWLTTQLNSSRRVGIPWQSIMAFLRITTHPRLAAEPFSAEDAWKCVCAWLDADVVWVPSPGVHHQDIFGDLVASYQIQGNLIPDAQLVALALEHGLTIYSCDTDFARFPEVAWKNPLNK